MTRLAYVAAILALAGLSACGSRTVRTAAPALSTVIQPARAEAAPQLTRQPVRFVDVTRSAGLDWTYSNGATGQHLFVETTGGGVAVLDYDRDGNYDLFAVQGGPTPGTNSTGPRPRSVLYRNNGDGTFRDVTAASGLEKVAGYGQGVSVADYDGDGWTDLYITAYGGNQLFRNHGGRFEDVTVREGVRDVDEWLPWPLSSAWGDYDQDGDLDLFVCHYVKWSAETNQPCRDPQGKLAYCRPQVYEGSPSRLYRNEGGSFRDVSRAAGIAGLPGKSMGATWLDHDEDGWLDLFVTNDTLPNFLLKNDGRGGFQDVAFMAGVAVGAQGAPMSGMGIGVGDYDNDGRVDLFDVNFAGEPKGVWRNLGGGRFENRSYATNLAASNLQFLGFGLELVDYDLDGFRDLVSGNGHVLDDPSSLGEGTSVAQSQQLFRNAGDGTFAEDLKSLGDLVHPRITRGLVVIDYDNDGDPDLVMVGQNGPLQLFRNDGGNRARWLGFRLVGKKPRDAVGARVTVRTRDRTLTGWVPGGSSYCSSSDPRLRFGLGDEAQASEVTVTWPSGARQTFRGLAPDAYYELSEGGQPRRAGRP